MLKRKIMNWVMMLCALFLLSACGEKQQVLNGETMGTYYSIKYVPDSHSPSQEVLQKEIDRILEEVNDQMSTYRPQSELSLFNQSREINKPFPVSAATAKVVSESIRINKMTQGSLDVTVGPLVNLWGFGPEGRFTHQPSADELEKRRQWIGIDYLEVQGNALIKKIPELYVDLSSIAKGYGVDAVAEYLISQHITNYMVDIGGEVRTQGVNGKDKPWRIAIEKPANDGTNQSVQLIIEPGDNSIATSGDYRNYFEEEGIRYSHTIDPTTGRPIKHNLASITVIVPTCMSADGISTGLNVLGPEKGLQVANELNIPVFMIVKTENGFEERYSKAFAPFLKK
ncbi:FAD:protein FMN transferase [Proteus myxofaciens]|uniref:FAD:protein FMN transferase n=1 Tax=Proteus myxofaciens ATCC 19692 TaxID=1354337 RepID=A0A198FIF2_9GAMM|nr:FAD:protein FMN transferase [Proteus myxofaciens]OAT24702.1 ApbE family thiamine biosynthesis lipoprotein [Proteus myxofaciens ATCC 19692]